MLNDIPFKNIIAHDEGSFRLIQGFLIKVITIFAPEVANSSHRFCKYLKLTVFLFHLENDSLVYYSFLNLGVLL